MTKALGFRSPKTPCAATIHNLLNDVVRLETALTKWVFSKLEDFQVLKTQHLEGVAIDGKELCGSKDPETGFRTHLLSAVFHELGVVIAQSAVSGKTNEIPISTELLKAFDVVGKVVTTDALLTQKTFCEEVLENQADYALPVKENQKKMYDDIRQLFAPLSETDPPEVEERRFENLHTEEGAHLDTHTDVEKARGCITTRTVTASTLLTALTGQGSHRFIAIKLIERRRKQVRSAIISIALQSHPKPPPQKICSNSSVDIGR